MPRRTLDADTLLDIRLSVICSHARWASDPGPVIAELIAAAGGRTELLARVAGSWAGFYDDQDTHVLCQAIVEQIPGASEWVWVGQQRQGARPHGAGGIHESPRREGVE